MITYHGLGGSDFISNGERHCVVPTEQKGAEPAFLGSVWYPDLFFSCLGVGWGQEVFLCALVSALLLNCIPGSLDFGYFKGFLCLFCVCVPACVCAAHTCRSPQPLEVTGVTGCCEPSCGCWKQSLSPLQERQMLLTAEPSLVQPLGNLFIYFLLF